MANLYPLQVLIVDDEVFPYEGLKTYFQAFKHQLEEEEDCVIEVLERIPSFDAFQRFIEENDEFPNYIFVDLSFGNSQHLSSGGEFNGFTILKYIQQAKQQKSNLRESNVFVFSNADGEDQIKRAFRYGSDGFILKEDCFRPDNDELKKLILRTKESVVTSQFLCRAIVDRNPDLRFEVARLWTASNQYILGRRKTPPRVVELPKYLDQLVNAFPVTSGSGETGEKKLYAKRFLFFELAKGTRGLRDIYDQILGRGEYENEPLYSNASSIKDELMEDLRKHELLPATTSNTDVHLLRGIASKYRLEEGF